MRISRKLLIKFSKDECTEAESKAVREWLEDGAWPTVPETEQVSAQVKRAVWKKIQGRLRPLSTPIRSGRHKQLRIAAIGLIAVIAGYLIYVLGFRSGTALQTTYRTAAVSQKILLPDSSVVYLAPHSQLALPTGYGENERQLHLTGKAAFEVQADARHPFVVITDNIRTTALGTSFRISSYPEAKRINVLLSYGKVKVDQGSDDPTTALYMEPGEEIVYDKADATLKKTAAGSSRFSYTQQVVYFKHADLHEVTEKLERFYHVKVDSTQLSGVHWKVSGEFRNQPLDLVMKTIAYSCNIHYQIKKGKVILLP